MSTYFSGMLGLNGGSLAFAVSLKLTFKELQIFALFILSSKHHRLVLDDSWHLKDPVD